MIGKINETHFKSMRLQMGIYRQRNSYMIRLCVKNANIFYKSLYLISYLLKKFDNNYLHLSTRMNFQLNWIKIENFYEILLNLNYNNIISIQSSGNCLRNVTFNYLNYKKNFIWINLIKYWFYLNYEFLFLPRKFKICFLNNLNDFNSLKFNDLSFYIKKFNNKLKLNIFLGGGLGRNVFINKLIFKNIHWKNIVNVSYNILKFYNILSLRNNIYKSRIKILFKNLGKLKFLNFISFNKKNIIKINEKELNGFISNFKIKNNLFYFKNKIRYNIFFLNWLFINNLNKFNFSLINFFKPSGDINNLQIKIKSSFKLKFLITEKHYMIFNSDIKNIYIFYKYFINFNYHNLLVNNYLSCPGLNYCNLANTNSIESSINLTYNLFLYNNIIKLSFCSINFSGCINSCSHIHLSNLGFLGFKKKIKDYFKFFLNLNNFYIKLSNNISSVKKNKINFLIFSLFKKFILNKLKNEYFINTYNRLERLYLKI